MPLNLARIAIAITISFTGLLGSTQYSAAQTTSGTPDASEHSDAPESGPESGTPTSPVQIAKQTTISASPEAESQKKNNTAEGADSHGSPASPPLFTNDAVVLGMLIGILALVFWTHSLQQPLFVGFYKIVPMLLLCYFLPSLLTTFGIVHPSFSGLPTVAKKFLLPASLVLLTVSIDLKEVLRLGPKALIMFVTGTIGVIIGGPIAILVVGSFDPQLVGGQDSEAVWRGLATVAGSWIGGGANQVAMKEIFNPSNELFSVMLAVDIVIGELWMVFLLLGIGKAREIDRILKADASSVHELQNKMEQFSKKIARNPTVADLFVILGIGFGVTACCHVIADLVAPLIDQQYPFLNKFSLNS